MKELDINKEYNNGGSLYLEDGFLYKVYNETSCLRESLNKNIDFMDKVSAIKDIYKSLKTLHSYGICIGDIHLSNFLYKDGHGYLIDLDEIRYPEDNFKFRERYLVKENIKSVPSKQASFITDNIKVCICCLSFLYGVDLENIICKYSLKSVKMVLKFLVSDEEYKEISKVLDVNKLCYFDDILVNRVNKSRVLKR